jgi:hypothetical protein
VIYIWILVTILTDLFRDHETSGWAKAAWVLFLVLIPLLTALVYLIVRGDGMRDRAIKHQAEVKKEFDQYVRQTAGPGPHSTADELAKLSDMKEKGTISDEDYERAKAKVLG